MAGEDGAASETPEAFSFGWLAAEPEGLGDDEGGAMPFGGADFCGDDDLCRLLGEGRATECDDEPLLLGLGFLTKNSLIL